MRVEYEAIGVIHTPHKTPGEAPIQPSKAGEARGRVELRQEYGAGLADLDGFSHILLLYHLHRTSGYQLRVVPFLDTRERGLFATRAPWRPNPIGLSVVRLERIERTTLFVRDVDMLDGTPLLDIKPYVPEFDQRKGVRLGWLDEALRNGRSPGKEE
jgi:tRNA-Thr(GGU) m(6)t(6)A37 methyltransferase TsaA